MADSLQQQLQASLGAAFTIERELGGGGMSRVFVATDAALGRQVVIKVLPPELAASVSIARFNREIGLAARLQHPHIVPLLSAGAVAFGANAGGGVPYFTMPFVEGESLRARLARHGELPVAEAIRILREVASALAYAHDRGVVHRDIKPDNVLLSGGSAMVTDFGVAKALAAAGSEDHGGVTSLGIALGTPAYMAPEQASADPNVDHRADIYAFGVLAYELLTGQPPFSGRTPQGLLAAHVTESPESISRRRQNIPAPLASLVMRCLEKRASDRPQSASEIVHALDAISTPSGGMQPTGVEPAVRPAMSNSVRSRPAIVAGVLALLLVVVLFAWQRVNRGAGAAGAPRSIAVLPLENTGGDTATQFFADGMTDELTSTLSKLPGVQVTSRSAAAAAVKAGGGDMKAVARRLHVGALLEGRIRRVGDRMRLTAQLTNAADGIILWSDTYEKEVKDAFQVQDDVARAIAAALRITLGADQQLATRGTTSPKAHDLYLRGRFIQAKYTEPDIRRSLELFQQALREDPNYAMAWAGIADGWGMLADDFLAPSEATPPMRDAVARGLAIDSSVAELWFTRGLITFFFDWDAVAGQQSMSAALATNPDLPYATTWYPFVLWTNGLRDSAAAFLRHAVDRDPTSPDKLTDAWSYARLTGNTGLAREYCHRLVELHTGEQCESLEELGAGRPERALAFADRQTKEAGVRVLYARRLALTVLVAAGRMQDARALVAEVDRQATTSKQYMREDAIAQMHGLVGDNDGAIKWYERALSSHSSGIGALYWATARNPIRKDPRLLALAKRAGLPDPPPYWP